MSETISCNRVLVADDEETFRRTTVEILRREGYAAEGACDGIEGLTVLQNRSFDLVISDLRMSGNDELEFVRKVTSDCSTPMIIVTGYPSIATAIDSVRLSVVDYLIKPIQPQEFLKRVDLALRRTCQRKKPEDQGNELGARMTLPQILNNQLQEIHRALKGLEEASRIASGASDPGRDLCHFMKCTNLEKHRALLRETVDTLVRTKSSFRSRELATLRSRIESFLADPS